MTVARYAVASLVGLALLVGAMLLVRPLIFSVAPARGDASYAVAAAVDLGSAAIERQLLLTQSHGLPGEQPNGQRVSLRVVISRPPSGGIAVVNAWSAVAACAVELAGDRLRDCEGATWTFDGVPISADRPLQRFPAMVSAGAVMVDFTRGAPAG